MGLNAPGSKTSFRDCDDLRFCSPGQSWAQFILPILRTCGRYCSARCPSDSVFSTGVPEDVQEDYEWKKERRWKQQGIVWIHLKEFLLNHSEDPDYKLKVRTAAGYRLAVSGAMFLVVVAAGIHAIYAGFKNPAPKVDWIGLSIMALFALVITVLFVHCLKSFLKVYGKGDWNIEAEGTSGEKKPHSSYRRIDHGEWQDPDAWDKHYADVIRLNDWLLGQAQRRDHHLGFVLNEIHRSKRDTPLKILDAGCGVTLIGDVLAAFGHEVTSIDISSEAIDFCNNREVTDEMLLSCIRILVECDDGPIMVHASEDKNRKFFDAHLRPGGSVTRQQCNWLELDAENEFDLIICVNGIKGIVDIEPSLRKFHKMLRPHGALVTTAQNALERQSDFEKAALDVGFKTLPPVYSLTIDHENWSFEATEDKLCIAYWPTG